MQNVWTTRTVYTTRNNLKVIQCARERCDNETCDRMQDVLNYQENKHQLNCINVVIVLSPRNIMSASLWLRR